MRVLIVADDPLARAGLTSLLNDRPDCQVVGLVAADDDLPRMLTIYRPDVVLWDLGWEAEKALERLADLTDSAPPLVVLIANPAAAEQAWHVGAHSLLLRDADAERLSAALHAAMQGLAVLDAGLLGTLQPLRDSSLEAPVEDLTPRERQVLQLLAEGLPNKTIAQQLGISEHTVKFHVNAILGKLNARSRTEAVTRATRLGLIIL